jgi:proto-oncogene tyrosine-protein kinase ROS
MTPLQLEKRLFWINVNNEIMSYVGSTKSKLLSVGASVLSMNIDWILRVLYWSQESGKGYAIYSLDLNRYEKYKHEPVIFYASMYKITNLIVSPMDMKIFWIETEVTDVGETSLIIYKQLDSDMTEYAHQFLDASIPCFTSNMTTVRQTLALDTSMDTGPSLVWADNTNTFYSTRISDKECYPIGFKYKETMFNSVRDGDRTYWIDLENDLILAQDTNDKVVYSYNATGYRQLLSFYHQNYPERKCLLPLQQQQKYRVILRERSADSLVVDLPKPQMHSNCSLKPASVKYTIYLKAFIESDTESCDKTKCTTIETYENTTRITGLNSFTKYRIQVGLSNYYSEKLNQQMKLGPLDVYSTSPGQPSQPRNVHAEAISPNEVVVNWSPPEHFNGDMIRYEVHWQTENIRSNLKNKQQQLVSGKFDFWTAVQSFCRICFTGVSFFFFTDYEPIEKNSLKKPRSMSLDKLLPSHSYTVSVRAYTSDSTYSESDTVEVKTFPEPNNITKMEETPQSMVIQWHPDEHISKYIVQYAMAGSPIWKTVFDSAQKTQQSDNYNDGKYSIRDLQPKTQYRFVILLYYAKRIQPYIWPSDSRFEFETLGDHPTAPGKPVIKLLKENTYQVLWEPAKENGAQIDEYNLEVRKQQQPSVVRAMQRRSAPSNIIEMQDEDYTKMENVTELEDYHNAGSEITDHDWHIYYNGTDPFTVIQKLTPINDYAFKVRARNSYGWGPYSSESSHIQESLVAPHLGPSKIVYGSIVSALIVVAILFVIITGLCCLCK